MHNIKIASVAVNQTALDFPGNLERLKEGVRQAKLNNADIITFPEMAITGYGCDDAWLYPRNIKAAWSNLQALANHCKNAFVTVGLPVEYEGALYNCIAVIINGEIEGLVAKQHLAGDGLHYEPRWFKPWPSGISKTIKVLDKNSIEESVYKDIPIGDIKFEVGGVTIGFEICEEAWVANRTGSSLRTDIIINSSASHTQFDKPESRVNMVREASRNFACVYIYTNLLGNSSGRAIYDGDGIIANNGSLIADGKRFSFKEVVVTYAVVDLDIGRMERRRVFSLPDNMDQTTMISDSSMAYIEEWGSSEDITKPIIQHVTIDKFRHFSDAISLALWDYMRKSRTNGYTLSLSGGADSSICAILVYEMVGKAIKDLGFDGVNKALSYQQNAPYHDFETMMHHILTCVYQPNKGISSKTTQNAARLLSEAINARYFEIPVGNVVKFYEHQAECFLDRPMNWKSDDISRQNLQARVRAPGVWMLANLTNTLLIATSNRSEAGVGYASMDGDTAGSIAPISGIDKEFILSFLNYYLNYYRANSQIHCAVSSVVSQEPTAELRPPGEEQTDEKDLMPYPVLRLVEYEAILNGRGIPEIVSLLETEFPNYTQKQCIAWVHKFFRLWSQNQWKRERYAPGFHIDHLSLCPKSFTRFPILSGNPID